MRGGGWAETRVAVRTARGWAELYLNPTTVVHPGNARRPRCRRRRPTYSACRRR